MTTSALLYGSDRATPVRAPAKRPYDEALMAEAIAEAERGRGRTSPNPLVGALIVEATVGEVPARLGTEVGIAECQRRCRRSTIRVDARERSASCREFDDAEFAVKVEMLREIDEYLRGLDKRVVQVSASLAASMQEVEILRPEGMRLSEARPMVRLNISVIVEREGRRESGSAGGGGRYGLSPLMGSDHWKAVAREALRIASVNLDAEPAPAGVMDVVLGPGWPGILLHEAIGHGLEGDFNRKQTSAFAGLMGTRIAAPGVTVVDDGTLPDRRGSISFDDEGTPSQRNVLIEDGILVGYMQDRQNARLMGVPATGNGRRESYAHAPMPRMTNTIMLGGETDPKDVLAGLKDGLYAVGFGGGQVDITNGKFVFSCTEAYRVKDGKVGAPVKGATLIGDGATALKQIRAIGNDMALDPGMGNCGKGGQWVPVGVGQPTLLIGGLTVGGSAA